MAIFDHFVLFYPDPFGLSPSRASGCAERLRRLEAYAPRLRDEATASPQPERIEVKSLT